LKVLAKERGLTRYNNLKKDELVKLHEDYDEDIEFIEDDKKDTDNIDDIVDEKDEENYKLKYDKLLEKYLELKTKLNK